MRRRIDADAPRILVGRSCTLLPAAPRASRPILRPRKRGDRADVGDGGDVHKGKEDFVPVREDDVDDADEEEQREERSVLRPEPEEQPWPPHFFYQRRRRRHDLDSKVILKRA